MSNDLGFTSENVLPMIEPAMKMLVRANTPLAVEDLRNTLSTFEIIEAIDMTREILLDHLTPETIVVDNGAPVVTGTGKKRRKDTTFVAFWNDIAEEVEDALYTHFTRSVQLSGATKISVHPMIRRVMKLVIHPVLDEIGKFSPSEIFKVLDSEAVGIDAEDIFGQMSMFVASGPVELQATKILVARKTLQNLCSTSIPKLNRILLIKKAVENLHHNKYDDETAPINQY